MRITGFLDVSKPVLQQIAQQSPNLRYAGDSTDMNCSNIIVNYVLMKKQDHCDPAFPILEFIKIFSRYHSVRLSRHCL